MSLGVRPNILCKTTFDIGKTMLEELTNNTWREGSQKHIEKSNYDFSKDDKEVNVLYWNFSNYKEYKYPFVL